MSESLSRDVKYAVKLLVRRPAFSLIAIAGLALGIGANTAIFSVVNALLLRPLPYPDSESLVMLWSDNTKNPNSPAFVSYPNFSDWRDQNQVFEGMAAYVPNDYALTGMGDPVRLHGAQANYNLFSVLGISPVQGRAFLPEEDKPDGPAVAMISYAAWQKLFAAREGLTGSNIVLDGRSTKIVGILPKEFNFERDADIRTPLGIANDPQTRLALNYEVVGRLKKGVSLSKAGAEMKSIAARLAEQYPKTNKNWSVKVVSLQDDIIGKFRTPLLIMLAAVFLVLLISCANVANLLLSHAASRQKEVAIRLAIGASRGRIVRQLLTESVILGLVGGGLGLGLAAAAVPALAALGTNIPRAEEIGIDFKVLFFALGVSIVTGIVFGLVPAIQSSKADLTGFMKEGTRGTSGGFVSSRLRGALVVLEVAVSLMLLICAGLLLKSFVKLAAVGPGFTAKGLVTFTVQLPAKYNNKADRAAFYTQTLESLKAIPGVESAASSTTLPLTGNGGLLLFYAEGRPHRGPEDYTAAGYNSVSPGYFATMNIPILRGRAVTDQDTADSERVAVISDSMARRFWANQDAIGKRLKLGGGPDSSGPWITVVGVVGDVKAVSLEEKEGEAAMYFPILQRPDFYGAFEVRTTRPLSGLTQDLKAAVIGVDKDQPIADLKTMDQVMTEYNAQRRLILILLGMFAAVALLLASIGVYGVISYSVTQRSHELGVRIALGANQTTILRMILREGTTLAVLGVVAGVSSAFALSHFLASMLYGVSTTDPVVFTGVSVTLLAVAVIACLVPALRATHVDPIVTLRYE